MSSVSFLHLRTHSAFSLAEGALKTSELIALCQEYGMPGVAVTDTNNLFGAMEFSLAACQAGIQPLIGCQLSVAPEAHDPRYVHHFREGDVPLDQILLYAQNEQGYRHLIKLVSEAYAQDPRHPPHIPFAFLKDHHESLICLSGAHSGGVSALAQQGFYEEAKAYFKALHEIFQDRFYAEISRLGEPSEKVSEPLLLDLAYQTGVPIVATNEAFFGREDFYEAHDALLCIAEGAYKAQDDRRRVSKNHRFRSPQEMADLFADLPEALQNTVTIAKRCAFMVETKAPMLPPFPSHKGEDDEIHDQAFEGLQKRLSEEVFSADQSPEEQERLQTIYEERLTYELKIIKQMGFSGYFLIVGDFIQWAKQQDIPVGPGRGSGAGSLVAWCLTITNVDPIRFNLIFERFLNPERVSMPDFDIDFCQDRRDEVIEYVRRRYGQDRVAQIITFGKLQARAVVKDVGRVMGLPYKKLNDISKLIPNNPANPVTLPEALEQEPDLAALRESDDDIKDLFDIAMKLEGLYRNASTHAAGVVIGGQPIDEIVALYRDHKAAALSEDSQKKSSQDIMPATQFHMKHVEMAGLVKFDFLGLKTLTVMKRTEELLKMRGIEIDIEKVPLDDARTFEFLSTVKTVGVFQLESTGMKDVIKRLKPSAFQEIIALVALYRPGPMDDIPRYMDCKHGKEEVTYLHPLLEDILKETYGVMVYQEQVMQIAQVLAGYSLGGADMLRRAMGKKIKSEMDAQRSIFLEGAIKNGVEKGVASQIFDQAAKFAGYGFNKCHSTPYALIAYQTAYLKANYPVDFMAASMTYDMHNTDRLSLFRQDLISMGIEVLPPDINKSFSDFRVEALPDGRLAVRYALGGIKKIGAPAARAIVEEREKGGPFKSPFDFAKRLESWVIKKRYLEKLIGAGALDSLEPNRASLDASTNEMVLLSEVAKKDRESPQTSLFGTSSSSENNQNTLDASMHLKKVRPWTTFERLGKEMETIGFYLSAHPLDTYAQALEGLGVHRACDLTDLLMGGNKVLSLAGVFMSMKERISKSGNKYAFATFSDATGEFEVTLFSETLSLMREHLVPGALLFLKVAGRLDEGLQRLTAQSLENLDDLLAGVKQTLRLKVTSQEALAELSQVLQTLPKGRSTLEIVLPCLQSEDKVLVTLPHRWTLDMKTLESIEMIQDVFLIRDKATSRSKAA